MKINFKLQIDRVVAAQGLDRDAADDQVRCRIHDASVYLKARALR